MTTRTLFFITLVLSSFSCFSVDRSAIRIDDFTDIDAKLARYCTDSKYAGIVLFYLSGDIKNADISIGKLDFSSLKELEEQKLSYTVLPQHTKWSHYDLSIQSHGSGLYYFDIPRGFYKFIDIKSTLYNFPSRSETDDLHHSIFNVDGNSINFIGEFHLSRDGRGKPFFKNINRYAKHQNEIKKRFDGTGCNIRSGHGVYDSINGVKTND